MKLRSTNWKVTAFSLAALGTFAVVPRPKTLAATAISPTDEGDRQAGEILTRRSNAKNAITREVIAGRLPLTHAAALFGMLNRVPPKTDRYYLEDALTLPFHLPVHTDDERLCRQVVTWVHHRLTDQSPARAQETLARLESEFRAELARTGHVQLPDASAVLVNWARELPDLDR